MRCDGCGEQFEKDELRDNLCVDCRYIDAALRAIKRRHMPPISKEKLQKIKKALFKVLLLFSLFLSAFAPYPACVDETPNWLYDSYCWGEYPVPGLPNYATQFLEYPLLSVGKATFYSPGAMEATAHYRGLSMDGYLGGVALMTCGDLGGSVWLRRPGHDWEGAYLVVDCARRNDLYGITVYREEAVEVDYKTAIRWGMMSYNNGDWTVKQWMIRNVEVSMLPPWEIPLYEEPLSLKDWFLENVQYSSGRAQDWRDYCAVMLPTINTLTPEAK